MKILIVASASSVQDKNAAESARLLAEALSRTEHEAVHSDRLDESLTETTVETWSTDIRAGWQPSGTPDVVHGIGIEAVQAALGAADGHVPVVATFLGRPEISPEEKSLARQCAGLLTLSPQEAQRWVGSGVPRDRIHVFRLPSSTTGQPDMPNPTSGYVVTDARDQALDAVLTSMRAWPQAGHRPRLVALTDPEAAEGSVVVGHLSHRPSDDVYPEPDLEGADLSQVVGGASIAVATEPRRDGGLALEAARHGVPSIAVDDDPLNELVVSGATGLVIPSPLEPEPVAKAVRYLLNNQTVLDGCGEGARTRVQAIHDPDLAARQALAAYAAVVPVDAPDQSDRAPVDRPRTDEFERLMTNHLTLARQLAHRYAGRGQALDELVGVANLGLVKAAERFDPDSGSEFPSYAVPTIRGELRRYFRDHAWTVRVPRTLQEHALDVDRTVEELRTVLGHEPTSQEVSEELDISDREVARAQQARHEALSSTSLDQHTGDDVDAGTLGDFLGSHDGRYTVVEDAQAVRQALQRLPQRERDIVVMSFYGERTQEEISKHLGTSQVHVSRTLAKTLATVRKHVLADAPLPKGWAPPAEPVDAVPSRAQLAAPI